MVRRVAKGDQVSKLRRIGQQAVDASLVSKSAAHDAEVDLVVGIVKRLPRGHEHQRLLVEALSDIWVVRQNGTVDQEAEFRWRQAVKYCVVAFEKMPTGSMVQ